MTTKLAAARIATSSGIAVRLADGSIVRVNAQSDVQLRQLRRQNRHGGSSARRGLFLHT